MCPAAPSRPHGGMDTLQLGGPMCQQTVEGDDVRDQAPGAAVHSSARPTWPGRQAMAILCPEKVGKTHVINKPFGNGLYHLFVVFWMVDYFFLGRLLLLLALDWGDIHCTTMCHYCISIIFLMHHISWLVV